MSPSTPHATVFAAIKAGSITFNPIATFSSTMMTDHASYESEQWKLQHAIDTWSFALNRTVSASFIRYMWSKGGAQLYQRKAAGKRRAHQRWVRRFKRKLRALVSP